MRPVRFASPALASVLAAALACFVARPAPSFAGAGGYALRGSVVGCGGTPTGSLTRRLLGTVGQPVVGVSTGAIHTLCHGFWCFGGSRVVSVDEGVPAASLPAKLAFGPAFPNPTAAAVRFAFDLPAAADVRLSVLDVQGRLVAEVEHRRFDPGFLSLGWDGRDASGRRVGAGVYFARLVVQGQQAGLRRIVLRD